MSSNTQSEESRLGTERIPSLMFRLAIPSVIAQLINVLYNIVDRMYIGHIPEIGDIALTGVGITFPILLDQEELHLQPFKWEKAIKKKPIKF